MSEAVHRKDVGGWLLFLCVALTILAPVVEAIRLFQEWSSVATHPELESIATAETAIGVSTTAMGALAGAWLWARWQGAVAFARVYLVALVGVSIAQPFVMSTIADALGFYGNAAESARADAVQSAVPPVISAVLWLAYLSFSKRVRATYYSESRTSKHRLLLNRSKNWLAVERAAFAMAVASALAALLVAATLEFSETGNWLGLERAYDVRFQALPSPAALSITRKSLPSDAVPFTYQNGGWGTQYVGFYGAKCEAKLNGPRSVALQNATGFEAWTMPRPRPSATELPDDECILAEYWDRYSVPTLTPTWQIENLLDNTAFRVAIGVSLASALLFFLYQLAWMPLVRWVKEG